MSLRINETASLVKTNLDLALLLIKHYAKWALIMFEININIYLNIHAITEYLEK